MQARQLLVLAAELLIQALDVGQIVAALGARLQILVSLHRSIQFLQDAPVIDQNPVTLGLMQTIDAGDGLDQVVFPERLVDVQHRIARLVEAGQQPVDDNQQVRLAIPGKTVQDPPLVAFLIVADMGVPPLLHLGQLAFIDFQIAFPAIRRRNHDGAADQAGIVEIALVADRIQLAEHRHLPFQAQAQLLDVLAEMAGNIPGDQLDAVGRTVNRPLVGEFLLQVGALGSGKPGRDLLEPAVHRVLVNRQLGHPLLIEQRRHRFILHRLLHRVGMDDGAELVGRLLLLQQRRAGKSHVGRQRQGFFHALMRLAAMAAMAFIDQHDQIRRRVVALRLARGGGELMDQRENDALGALADALGQLPAGLRPRLLAFLLGGDGRAKSAAADEIARQLVFQIDPISYHHDPAGFQVVMDDQRLGQKDHCETLARARRVPDDAALPPAIRPALLDAFEQGADAEKLLVARHHLADFAVEEHKKAQELEQPGRRQQGRQQPVLLGRQHRLRPQLLEVMA